MLLRLHLKGPFMTVFKSLSDVGPGLLFACGIAIMLSSWMPRGESFLHKACNLGLLGLIFACCLAKAYVNRFFYKAA